MQGLHLTADLSGCDASQALMRDPATLRRQCLKAVDQAGLQSVAELFHAFEPAGSGITGVVLLAESHLAVHTWPELGAVTLDIYVCNFSGNNSAKAHQLMQQLQQAFAPRSVQAQQLKRGLPAADPAGPAPRA